MGERRSGERGQGEGGGREGRWARGLGECKKVFWLLVSVVCVFSSVLFCSVLVSTRCLSVIIAAVSYSRDDVLGVVFPSFLGRSSIRSASNVFN